MDGYIGEIRIFAGMFAPRNWEYCNGRLLQISEYSMLNYIIGDIYGGDGRTNFNLPDLRGIVPIGIGAAVGIQHPVGLGERTGQETTQLTVNDLPAHSHHATFVGIGSGTSEPLKVDVAVNAHNGQGSENNPKSNYWAVGTLKDGFNTKSITDSYSADTSSLVKMNENAVNVTVTGGGGGITGGNVTIQETGGDQIFNNRQPSLGINYIICVNGIFPSKL